MKNNIYDDYTKIKKVISSNLDYKDYHSTIKLIESFERIHIGKVPEDLLESLVEELRGLNRYYYVENSELVAGLSKKKQRVDEILSARGKGEWKRGGEVIMLKTKEI